MSKSAAKRISGCVGVLAGVLCAGAALAAPTASPPNFSSNASVSWLAVSAGFKPPGNGAGPLKDDPAHPTVTNDDFRISGKQPTFPVADLTNPILQPWVRDALRKHNQDVLAGKPGFGPRQSCWPRGVPGFLLEGVFQPVFIVQSVREVVFIAESDHQVRHIYLNVPHSANVKPSWFGDSIGHYEGDTLVVDTIGLNDRTFVDDYLTPHTDKLHIVERFRLTDGGKGLEVNLHVEDPGAFTMPWDAIQRYRRLEPGVAEHNLVVENDGTSGRGVAGPLIEYICAENPISYFGKEALPLPRADKPDF